MTSGNKKAFRISFQALEGFPMKMQLAKVKRVNFKIFVMDGESMTMKRKYFLNEYFRGVPFESLIAFFTS